MDWCNLSQTIFACEFLTLASFNMLKSTNLKCLFKDTLLHNNDHVKLAMDTWLNNYFQVVCCYVQNSLNSNNVCLVNNCNNTCQGLKTERGAMLTYLNESRGKN